MIMSADGGGMKIRFVIYQGMTALDFIGVYDPLTRLKTMGFTEDLTWDICAHSSEVKNSTGLAFIPTKVREGLGEGSRDARS